MDTLVEIVSPGFLLREALIGSVLVGCMCPLVGVYFVLRRMIFLGVALPQMSAAGIAFAFLVYRILVGQHQHFVPNERLLALLGSLSWTLVGLLILAALARHRETVEARIGTTYAIAAAATILFLALDPAAEAHMVNLLGLDRQTAHILDRNSPDQIRPWPRAAFLREWKQSGGWAVTSWAARASRSSAMVGRSRGRQP